MDQEKLVRVLGIAGSLRAGSYNRGLIEAAKELAPPSMSVESFDLTAIPIYNEDLRQAGLPGPVLALREAIATADALLIATPEYNYSIPGMLKNAIDWASRPPDQPFDKKPVAIMGASPGRLGTARAQYHLRQCFVFLNAFVINKPEVMVGGAADQFDDHGRLTDETTREFVAKLLVSLQEATLRLAVT